MPRSEQEGVLGAAGVGAACVCRAPDVSSSAPASASGPPPALPQHFTTSAFRTPHSKPWISEMYGYSFAAAKAGLHHRVNQHAMLYPEYLPLFAPRWAAVVVVVALAAEPTPALLGLWTHTLPCCPPQGAALRPQVRYPPHLVHVGQALVHVSRLAGSTSPEGRSGEGRPASQTLLEPNRPPPSRYLGGRVALHWRECHAMPPPPPRFA